MLNKRKIMHIDGVDRNAANAPIPRVDLALAPRPHHSQWHVMQNWQNLPQNAKNPNATFENPNPKLKQY
jgi:hypothetical protein